MNSISNFIPEVLRFPLVLNFEVLSQNPSDFFSVDETIVFFPSQILVLSLKHCSIKAGKSRHANYSFNFRNDSSEQNFKEKFTTNINLAAPGPERSVYWAL